MPLQLWAQGFRAAPEHTLANKSPTESNGMDDISHSVLLSLLRRLEGYRRRPKRPRRRRHPSSKQDYYA